MERGIWIVAAMVLAAAAPAGAQTETTQMSAIEIAVACAPPPTFERESDEAPRVVGSQDTVPRTIFGGHDLLVLDSGTDAGLQLGQRFYVRRANASGMYRSRLSTSAMYVARPSSGRGARTVGWVHIVAANGPTAIVQVDHTCADLAAGDYLEPFVPPVVPGGIESSDAAGEPDFSALGRVVNGSGNRSTFGNGDFMLIDRGSEQGVVPGQRLAIYRDLHRDGLPLVSVGEAIVVSMSGSAALTRITSTRDAVYEGDYVAPRK